MAPWTKAGTADGSESRDNTHQAMKIPALQLSSKDLGVGIDWNCMWILQNFSSFPLNSRKKPFKTTGTCSQHRPSGRLTFSSRGLTAYHGVPCGVPWAHWPLGRNHPIPWKQQWKKVIPLGDSQEESTGKPEMFWDVTFRCFWTSRHRKWPCSMERKQLCSMAMFNNYVQLPEGITCWNCKYHDGWLLVNMHAVGDMRISCKFWRASRSETIGKHPIVADIWVSTSDL